MAGRGTAGIYTVVPEGRESLVAVVVGGSRCDCVYVVWSFALRVDTIEMRSETEDIYYRIEWIAASSTGNTVNTVNTAVHLTAEERLVVCI